MRRLREGHLLRNFGGDLMQVLPAQQYLGKSLFHLNKSCHPFSCHGCNKDPLGSCVCAYACACACACACMYVISSWRSDFDLLPLSE